MVITKEQIRELLNAYETDYDKAAELGPQALPHLESLVKEANPMLAPRATYMASLIDDERSPSILMIAARSDLPEVRIAAAAGSRNQRPHVVNDVLELLKNDQDSTVRRKALQSIRLMHGNNANEKFY